MVLEPFAYQLTLTALGVGLLALAHVLGTVARKSISQQDFISFDDVYAVSGGKIGTVIAQWLYALTVFGAGWTFGGIAFDILAGGYVIVLLVNLMHAIHSSLYFSGLGDPDVASGKLHYKRAFNHKMLAYQQFAAAVLVLCLFGLFGLYHFLGAGLILIATSIGCYRRARQAKAA